MLLEEIKSSYKTFKEKKGDNLLIQIGIVGVIIGWIFSLSFLNQVFAWFILVGLFIKLFDYVVPVQQNKDNQDEILSAEIQSKWANFKAKNGDTLLIQIGFIGVILGWIFSLSILNQIFAWFILVGVVIKLYDYVSSDKKNVQASK